MDSVEQAYAFCKICKKITSHVSQPGYFESHFIGSDGLFRRCAVCIKERRTPTILFTRTGKRKILWRHITGMLFGVPTLLLLLIVLYPFLKMSGMWDELE